MLYDATKAKTPDTEFVQSNKLKDLFQRSPLYLDPSDPVDRRTIELATGSVDRDTKALFDHWSTGKWCLIVLGGQGSVSVSKKSKLKARNVSVRRSFWVCACGVWVLFGRKCSGNLCCFVSFGVYEWSIQSVKRNGCKLFCCFFVVKECVRFYVAYS